MATVQEFFSTIRGVARRGTALDAELPRVFRQSLRFIEQNYSLPYMRQRVNIGVPQGVDTVSIGGALGASLKSIKFLRWKDSAGTYNYLRQVEPGEITSDAGDTPVGYEMYAEPQQDGTYSWKLRFDTTWKEEEVLDLASYHYTMWNGNEMDAGVWLVNNAEQALLARCMINLAPIMRDAAVQQMYQGLWLESVGTLVAAASEMEQGNR